MASCVGEKEMKEAMRIVDEWARGFAVQVPKHELAILARELNPPQVDPEQDGVAIELPVLPEVEGATSQAHT